MEKGNGILFIDPQGKEHPALVSAIKRRNAYTDRNGQEHVDLIPVSEGEEDCLATGYYIDLSAPEKDSLKQFHDVPHFTDPSRQESNPALPSYQVNCWKEFGERHNALPEDHPQFDHPFHREWETDKEGNYLLDKNGNKVPKVKDRPAYAEDIADHQATPETQAAMAEAEQKVLPAADVNDAMEFLKQRQYSEEDAKMAVNLAPAEQVTQMAEVYRESLAAKADSVPAEPGVIAQLQEDAQKTQPPADGPDQSA